MADDTETIIITGDVSSLKEQLNVAQIELTSFNSAIKETTTLMSRMGSSGAASLQPYLTELRQRAADTTAEINQLTIAIKNYGNVQNSVVTQTPSSSFNRMVSDLADVKTSYLSAKGSAEVFSSAAAAGLLGTAEATGTLNLATSGAIQEYIRLGHEAMTGNYSRMPGSAVVLASRMGGLTLSTLGTVAAYVALGAALVAPIATLGILTLRQHEADEEAKNLAEQFALTGRGATNTKDAIEGEISTLQQMTGVTRAIASETVAWDAAHADVNDKIANAANQLLPQFVSYGKNAVSVLGGIKQSLAEINDSPIKNAVSAFDELNTKFLRLPQSEANAISRMIELGQRTEAVTRILADLAAQGGGSIQKIDQQVIEAKEDVQRAKDQLELLQHTAALPGNPESIYAIQEAALLARHEVDTLEASLKKLLGEQSARNPIIPIDASQVSDQLTRIAQDVQKTNAQILQDQVTYLKQEEQAHNLSASARHYIETTLQSKLVDLARKTSADNIETMHATENAAGLIGTARLNREIADDRKAIADKNTTAEDRLRLERELGDKLSQLHQLQFNAEKKLENDKHSWLQQLYDEQLQVMKTALKEEADAEKSAAQADLSIARSVLDQKKDILNRELTDFQITAQEKFQMEKQYAIEAEMAEEKAIMAEGLTAQQTYDKIRVLRAKLNTDLAKLDTQMEQESVHTWRDILAPIQTATTSIFSNIVTRAQTVGQLMRGVLQQLVLDFATARIKIEFDWLAGQAAMALGAQKWASKSLIEWVASELGIQTAKEETAATTESTDAALAASGATTAYLTAASQIATDAAVAGAGAYAATAMIPYVGPALAPGAAATAYAGALSFEGALALPALATGTMNVPQDMLAFIHEGESVVPKEFAQGLRESGSIFNNQRGGDINLHYGPHIMGDHQKSLTELLDDQPYALLDMLTRLNRNGALQQALR